MKKKILIAILVTISSVVIFLGIDYLFFYTTEIKENNIIEEKLLEAPPGHTQLTPAELDLLGWLFADKESHFVRKKKHKKEEIIRVGCFGCSFTQGSETGPRGDYPTILGQLFYEQGHKNIEAINFGSGGYGFHQAYLLFDLIGRSYGLDVLVFGPETFFENRDFSFRHGKARQKLIRLHAKYILWGKQNIKLLPVIGKTPLKKQEAYNSFFPHWQYLRYDYYAPAFLSCITKDKELKNPFYYALQKNEIQETHRRLFQKLSDEKTLKKIVVITNAQKTLRLLKKTQINKVAYGKPELPERSTFPYYAPYNHLSIFGNQLFAQQVYMAVTGCELQKYRVIRSYFVEQPKILTFSAASTAAVLLETIPLGTFFEHQGDGQVEPITNPDQLQDNLLILRNGAPLKTAFLQGILPGQELRSFKLKVQREAFSKMNRETIYELLLPKKLQTGIYLSGPLNYIADTGTGVQLKSFQEKSGKTILLSSKAKWTLLCNEKIILTNFKNKSYNKVLVPKITQQDEKISYASIPETGKIYFNAGKKRIIFLGYWKKEKNKYINNNKS